MKYLCLVYGEESAMQTVNDSECVANGEALQRSGHYVAAESLQPVATAATVRVRGGRVLLFDVQTGEFAPNEEFMALAGLRQVVRLRDGVVLEAVRQSDCPTVRLHSVWPHPCTS